MTNFKKLSQKQEKSVAKDLNAKTVIASGALWGSKGDVRSDKFLIECKTTEKPYYSLTAKVWNKIRTEAIRDGLRIPVMCIAVQGKSYAILEYSMVEDFYDRTKYSVAGVPGKSFRVKQEDGAFFPLPRIYLCSNVDWGSTERLVQIPWEQFVEISNKI